MNTWHKKEFIQLLLGIIAYTIILFFSVIFHKQFSDAHYALKFIIALLPAIPFIFSMTAVIKNTQKFDELQRRIEMESVLITALVTGAITFSYGLLESSDLLPHFPVIWIAPAMIFGWGITRAILMNKYQ